MYLQNSLPHRSLGSGSSPPINYAIYWAKFSSSFSTFFNTYNFSIQSVLFSLNFSKFNVVFKYELAPGISSVSPPT